MNNIRELWVQGFNGVAQQIEDWANRKGWNEDDPVGRTIKHETVPGGGTPHSRIEIDHPDAVHYDLAKHALMVSELAESMEGRRHNDPQSDKIPQFTVQEEELADCIVRIMHYASHRKIRVAEALVAKLDYNENRPYKHGKQA